LQRYDEKNYVSVHNYYAKEHIPAVDQGYSSKSLCHQDK